MPSESKLSQSFNLDLLKLIAIISMVIDHVHLIWFNRYWEPVRWMGLLAFPLFCFILTYNYMFHSSDKIKLLKRLVIFAFISQVPYQWAFGLPWDLPGLNIFITLSLGMISIYAFETWLPSYKHYGMLCYAIALLIFEYLTEQAYSWPLDGGISGIAMIVAMCLLFQKTPHFQLSAWLIIACALYILDNTAFLFSFGSIAFAYYISGHLPADLSFMRKHKTFFYLFYPAHLALIKVLLLLIPMYFDYILK